jgi:hypothetical protein
MSKQINLPNIKGYIQGNFRRILSNFGSLPKHIEEQAEWRLKQVEKKSPQCLTEKGCVHCGCEIISKAFEKRGCSSENPCYPEMMSEQEWAFYKLNNLYVDTTSFTDDQD